MKRLTLLLTTAVVLAGCATTTSPTGRRQATGAVSQAQLNQMGAQAIAVGLAKQKLSTDARANAYVRCVVNALVAQLPAQQRGIAWEVALFQDDSANAFALPGGKVGVNTGIFKVATNQDQLAAVIGHEIGHVIARHSAERLSQSVLAEAGMGLVGAYAGRNASPDQVKQLVALLGAGTQVGVLLPYSRLHESEADRIGQELMAKAGFDPREAARLWENMIQASAASPNPPRLLSTHPDSRARAQALSTAAPALLPEYEAARRRAAPRCS